jgi:hypothetical protein
LKARSFRDIMRKGRKDVKLTIFLVYKKGEAMLEELIDEYIRKADTWNRIFSKIKVSTFLLCLSPFCVLLFYPFLLKFKHENWWEYVALLITMMPAIILFFIVNFKAQKVLGIENKTILWNSLKNRKIIYDFELDVVEDLLRKNKCYDSNKINIIVRKLKNIITNDKFNIALPISISVFIFPIWEHWISFIFDICKTSDQLFFLIKFLFLSVYILIAIIFLFVLIKDVLKNLYNTFINRRNVNIKYLISILEDISFTLEIKK